MTQRVSDNQVCEDVEHMRGYKLSCGDKVMLDAGYPADLRDARHRIAALEAEMQKCGTYEPWEQESALRARIAELEARQGVVTELEDGELLPCPFCGGTAERIDISDGENAGGSCVHCTRCDASSNVEFEFKENFIDNWNRRTAALAVAKERTGGLPPVPREDNPKCACDYPIHGYQGDATKCDRCGNTIAVAGDGWEPIETAPRDGRQILVGFLGQFEWVYFIAAARGGQTNAAGYALPTHWRPLPPAPKEG